MKFSDLMLDMATGDASPHDVYIQEAVGKINVSTAIFDAAYKISELPEEGRFAIVQEAADAGLPTDQEGACTLACESVKQSMAAFYDLLVSTAKKIKQSVEKDMKALSAIGKKYGVSSGEDFKSFVANLAKAIVADNGKKLTLPDKRFLKAKYSDDIADCYGAGMANFLSAYGVSVGNTILADEYNAKKDVNSFKSIKKNFSYGGKCINFDKTVNKEKHYTNGVTASDITSLGEALFTIYHVSKTVIDNAGSSSAKKSSMSLINGLCDKEDCGGKKVSKTLEQINEGIKDWTANVTTLTDITTKAFTDSIYALSSAVTGQPGN